MYDELDVYLENEKGITYKEICELTGIKYTNGKSKTLQLKDIERYYRMNKIKTRFVILEKYSVPILKEDKRSEGKNSKTR